MASHEIAASNGTAIWDLPTEILQQISDLLASKDHLQWMLASQWFSWILSIRLVPNAVARDEGSAFAWACHNGRLDVMRQCLDLGMSATRWHRSDPVGRWNCAYRPVVAMSLLSGHVDAVRLLISRGATLDEFPPHTCRSGFQSQNPLYYVRHTSTLQFLIDYSPEYISSDRGHYIRELFALGVPDDTMILAAENSPSRVHPELISEAAKGGRVSLIEKLFQAAPELAGTDDEGRLFNGNSPLLYILEALSARSQSHVIQEMLEVINRATSALPARSFTLAKSVLGAALDEPRVKKESLVWLLNNGLLDFSTVEARTVLHAALSAKSDFIQRFSPSWVLKKWEVLLQYDDALTLYSNIGNGEEFGNITYPRFLKILEGKLKNGALAPEIALKPSRLLTKVLKHGTSDGTLHRTAGVVDMLVALGASGADTVMVQYSPDNNAAILTALLFACMIKLDPQQGRRRFIPESTTYDMSAEEGITTYEDYLTLRRASIVRIVRAVVKGCNIFAADAYDITALGHAIMSGIYDDLSGEFQEAYKENTRKKPVY